LGKGKEKIRYSEEFRQSAVGRMLGGANVKQLSRELKAPRSVLFDWRKKAIAGVGFEKEEQRKDREIAILRAQIHELEAALGRRMQELDFFVSALRRVGASIPVRDEAGKKTSVPKSAAGWNRKANN
jgi:transposase-like protein